MPQTTPSAPPKEPETLPEPQYDPETEPEEEELDPFNPAWPEVRPTPEPKAFGLGIFGLASISSIG